MRRFRGMTELFAGAQLKARSTVYPPEPDPAIGLHAPQGRLVGVRIAGTAWRGGPALDETGPVVDLGRRR